MTLRLATIILPTTDNNGMPFGPKRAHEWLRNAIMGKFGGVTMTDVKGMWRNDEGTTFVDDSIKYEFACPDLPSTIITINEFARQAGEFAGQEAMFVQYPNGDIAII